MKPPFTMGSDPEFMIRDRQGKYVSAIGVVPATKKEPLDLGGGAKCFPDNVLAECCPAPGRDLAEVLANFRHCFTEYAKVVAPYRLVAQASQEYPEEACRHKAAREFGCDPEQNAYTRLQVNAPYCEPGNTFRTGGGHVHVGHQEGSWEFPLVAGADGKAWMIRWMDVFVGVPSVLMDNDPTSQARRRLYGGAGNYREKSYGCEYRSMSNWWVGDPEDVEAVHNLVWFTICFVQDNADKLDAVWAPWAERCRETINSGDRAAALAIVSDKSYPLAAKLKKVVLARMEKPRRDFYKAWGIRV